MSTYKIGVVIGVGSPIHSDAPLLGHLLTPDGDQLLTFNSVVEAQAHWNEHHQSSRLAPYFQYHTPCSYCGAEAFVNLKNIANSYQGCVTCAECGKGVMGLVSINN